MNFKEITDLVFQGCDLPNTASMADEYAYHILTCINYEYKNKLISRENATRKKERLISEYEELKQKEETLETVLAYQAGNIGTSEQIRIRINHAVNKGEMSKELFLEAVKCIGLMCGTLSQYKTCEKLLKEVEYEEQETMPI
ncbi:hypothetical protein [Bacilliculturomica massiliensis]|uniref:hypothetical protein n=1 Tax=Bacilliculturomica massiliensis TaxID=1917867 RepID=UPI001030E80C|nr:hypothetical protein [Bacilliculturomica massiliensis]